MSEHDWLYLFITLLGWVAAFLLFCFGVILALMLRWPSKSGPQICDLVMRCAAGCLILELFPLDYARIEHIPLDANSLTFRWALAAFSIVVGAFAWWMKRRVKKRA